MHILIIDDHPLFTEGLQHVLHQSFDPLSITMAYSVSEAQRVLDESTNFQLILLDLSLPDLNGIELLQNIIARQLWIPVVILSAQEDTRIIKHAIRTGALGFIPKSHNSTDLINALKIVLRGEVYLPKNIHERLRSQAIDSSVANFRSHGLTKRQFEVLSLMAMGNSNKEIASSLFLTNNTVKTHISAIFKALQVTSRLNCILYAEEIGLLTSSAD